MYTLKISDVKAACAKAVTLCHTENGVVNPTVLDYINRAQERLLYKRKWKGTTQTYRLCVDAHQCVVWPREIETVEALTLCDTPASMRGEWYEIVEGVLGAPACGLCLTAIDRGEVPAFDEIEGAAKKIAVYADKTEGTGKYVTLQFWDENGNWVRTQFNGQWIDGEKIAIPSTAGLYNYTNLTVRAGGLKAVTKDTTAGVIRLYEYNTVGGALKPLAYYQPDENIPVYRRSYIPGLDVGGDCDQQQVTAVAKLRFIPAINDDSFVMISHREALRLACKAVYLEECDNWTEAMTNWAQCFQCLDDQLNHYRGDGVKAVMPFASNRTFGGASVYAVQ